MLVGNAFGMDKYEKYKQAEKQIDKLDKERVPFTSPRYQGFWDDYIKAKREWVNETTVMRDINNVKKRRS